MHLLPEPVDADLDDTIDCQLQINEDVQSQVDSSDDDISRENSVSEDIQIQEKSDTDMNRPSSSLNTANPLIECQELKLTESTNLTTNQSVLSESLLQSEILQKLVNEAVKKIISESTLLSHVDASLILGKIDKKIIADSVSPKGICFAADESNKKRCLYPRPAGIPDYQPTPISELNRRKSTEETSHSKYNEQLNTMTKPSENNNYSPRPKNSENLDCSSDDNIEKDSCEFNSLDRVIAEKSLSDTKNFNISNNQNNKNGEIISSPKIHEQQNFIKSNTTKEKSLILSLPFPKIHSKDDCNEHGISQSHILVPPVPQVSRRVWVPGNSKASKSSVISEADKLEALLQALDGSSDNALIQPVLSDVGTHLKADLSKELLSLTCSSDEHQLMSETFELCANNKISVLGTSNPVLVGVDEKLQTEILIKKEFDNPTDAKLLKNTDLVSHIDDSKNHHRRSKSSSDHSRRKHKKKERKSKHKYYKSKKKRKKVDSSCSDTAETSSFSDYDFNESNIAQSNIEQTDKLTEENEDSQSEKNVITTEVSVKDEYKSNDSESSFINGQKHHRSRKRKRSKHKHKGKHKHRKHRYHSSTSSHSCSDSRHKSRVSIHNKHDFDLSIVKLEDDVIDLTVIKDESESDEKSCKKESKKNYKLQTSSTSVNNSASNISDKSCQYKDTYEHTDTLPVKIEHTKTNVTEENPKRSATEINPPQNSANSKRNSAEESPKRNEAEENLFKNAAAEENPERNVGEENEKKKSTGENSTKKNTAEKNAKRNEAEQNSKRHAAEESPQRNAAKVKPKINAAEENHAENESEENVRRNSAEVNHKKKSSKLHKNASCESGISNSSFNMKLESPRCTKTVYSERRKTLTEVSIFDSLLDCNSTSSIKTVKKKHVKESSSSRLIPTSMNLEKDCISKTTISKSHSSSSHSKTNSSKCVSKTSSISSIHKDKKYPSRHSPELFSKISSSEQRKNSTETHKTQNINSSNDGCRNSGEKKHTKSYAGVNQKRTSVLSSGDLKKQHNSYKNYSKDSKKNSNMSTTSNRNESPSRTNNKSQKSANIRDVPSSGKDISHDREGVPDREPFNFSGKFSSHFKLSR